MTVRSANRSSLNPQNNLYQHAPFAETLNSSICLYLGNEGLVQALYGPWGLESLRY